MLINTNNIFFTSDTHYGHGKIIQYCNRPFNSVPEMDEELVQRYNKVVKPGDIVYHLGDFSFHYTQEEIEVLLKRLNGRKIFVSGNHDKDRQFNRLSYQEHFRILELTGKFWSPYNPTLCHFPMMSWNGSFHGTFHLHGHTHGNLPFDPSIRRLDVGVDVHEFAPVSWDDVILRLKNIPTPKDAEKLKDNDERKG